MAERPIIFSGAMVRAILAGTKTVTRRVLTTDTNMSCAYLAARVRCPYDVARLWVRETFAAPWGRDGDVYYRADGNDRDDDGSWKPSIYMPRWASRITLAVESVRVERLQDITDDDARAEGVTPSHCDDRCDKPHVHEFYDLWKKINGKRPGCSWDDNPWVWVVAFRRADSTIGEKGLDG